MYIPWRGMIMIKNLFHEDSTPLYLLHYSAQPYIPAVDFFLWNMEVRSGGGDGGDEDDW